MMKEIPTEVLYTKGPTEVMAYDWVQGIGNATGQVGQKIKLTKTVRWARDPVIPDRPEHKNLQPPTQAINSFNINHPNIGDESNIE